MQGVAKVMVYLLVLIVAMLGWACAATLDCGAEGDDDDDWTDGDGFGGAAVAGGV